MQYNVSTSQDWAEKFSRIRRMSGSLKFCLFVDAAALFIMGKHILHVVPDTCLRNNKMA